MDNCLDTPGGAVGERGKAFTHKTDVRVAVAAEPPVSVHANASALLEEYGFLRDAGIAADVLWQACREGAERQMAPHLLMIHGGTISAQQYLEILQQHLGAATGRSTGGVTEFVDALSQTPAGVALLVANVSSRGNVALLMMPQHIDWTEPAELRRLRAEHAANGLLRRNPELSAGHQFANWQIIAAPIVPGMVIGGFVVLPELTLIALGALVTLPFVFIVTLRVLSLLLVLRPTPQRVPASIPDAQLPVYSIIVPLFREAHVVPGLVDALLSLDYPPARLDILLVTESIDTETQQALRALALPPHMRVLAVPDIPPRTKPKALNYALSHSRGAFVVVYDAEDAPEPDQLRKAKDVFRNSAGNLMCVQARLALYNPRPGWIARQFMLEYAALFDAMLPALVRLRVPLPLGGTSNHFPRHVLEALGGWDAYNVTEDADLGMRIARAGRWVAVLESTTFEEAPERLSAWLPQRTRWLKGFMQTWLVHMRRPVLLYRELGLGGFLGFNALLGGLVVSALLHPVFLAVLVWQLSAGDVFAGPESPLALAWMRLAVFNLVAGYASAILLAALAAKRRGIGWLIPQLALMPIYWLLISAAAYRAAYQLMTKPYLWEKTPHAPRQARSGGSPRVS